MLTSTNQCIPEGTMRKYPPLKKAKSYFSKPSMQQGLGSNDVICGRHKDASTNVGNRRFRILVAVMTQKYISAPTRAHKSMVIRDVVETIHGCGGKFVRQCKFKRSSNGATLWEELSEKQIYDKVGHAFRDMLVSIQDKSDINYLLSPSQAPSFPSMQTIAIEDVAENSDSISEPNFSMQVSQYSAEQEQKDAADHLNAYDCDVDSDYFSSFTLTDDELEQCLGASEAKSESISMFDNNLHTNGTFQDDCTNIKLLHQWRRDSVKSFQCLVL